jgi:hypothetical protein
LRNSPLVIYLQAAYVSLFLRAPDQLIGNLVEIIAHEIWLWTDLRQVAAGTLDQCRAPAGCLGANRIADVTGDHKRIRRLRAQLARDIGIGLGRWFVTLDPVNAETTLEEIDGAAAPVTCRDSPRDCR